MLVLNDSVNETGLLKKDSAIGKKTTRCWKMREIGHARSGYQSRWS